ncbi:hypothetical protein GCM10025771_16920 [Niveibacterium umoris]|uniref:Uncharacterized protein n=1 Tax=Niveibacterium umoris TaxID=1193620 RepID=A0A840BSQ4_9RHOO|nr:hypothetical protein [Niveibacterium umoris]MBB4014439.1 hypothetical protein [Niveibacterium umoris]
MSEQVFRIASEDDFEDGIAEALAEIDPDNLDDLIIEAHGEDDAHHETFRRMLDAFAAEHERRLLEHDGSYFFLPLKLH